MSRPFPSAIRCTHRLRDLATIVLTVLYMLVGGLHLFCDNDVAIGSATGAIASVSDAGDADATGKSAVADHHCHGCFAASIPAQALVAVPVEVVSAVVARPYVHRVDTTPRHDTPPPKFLS